MTDELPPATSQGRSWRGRMGPTRVWVGWTVAGAVIVAAVTTGFFLTVLVGAVRSHHERLRAFDSPYLALLPGRPIFWTIPLSHGERIRDLPEIAASLREGPWDQRYPRSIEAYTKFTVVHARYGLMAMSAGFPRAMPQLIHSAPGAYQRWLDDPEGLMVDDRVMRDEGWRVGQRVSVRAIFGELTGRVSGVFRGAMTPRVIAHLEQVRPLAGPEAEEMEVILVPCRRELQARASRAVEQALADASPPVLVSTPGSFGELRVSGSLSTMILWLDGAMVGAGLLLFVAFFALWDRRERVALPTRALLLIQVGSMALGCVAAWMSSGEVVELRLGASLTGRGVVKATVSSSSLWLGIAITAAGAALTFLFLWLRRTRDASPGRVAPGTVLVCAGSILATLLLVGWHDGLDAMVARSAPLENQTIVGLTRRKLHVYRAELEIPQAMQARVLEALGPDLVAKGKQGPLISPEYLEPIATRVPDSLELAFTTLRGVDPVGYEVHGVRVIGSRPRPGQREVLLGPRLLGRFEGFSLGGSIQIGGEAWRVVGTLDAPGTLFESEVWGDRVTLTDALGTEQTSLITLRLRRPEQGSELARRLTALPPTLRVVSERAYYDAYSSGPTRFRTLLWPMWLSGLLLFAASLVWIVEGTIRGRGGNDAVRSVLTGVLGGAVLAAVLAARLPLLYKDHEGVVYFSLLLSARAWTFAGLATLILVLLAIGVARQRRPTASIPVESSL